MTISYQQQAKVNCDSRSALHTHSTNRQSNHSSQKAINPTLRSLGNQGIQRQALNIKAPIESQIHPSRNNGLPLSQSVRNYFEPRFKHDFSRIRVHTNADAAKSAHAINARAFTLGQDITFAAGQYSPHTSEGKRLLAHELTHTLQQGQKSLTGNAVIQREVHSGDDADCGKEFLFKFTGVVNDEKPEKHRGVPRYYYAPFPTSENPTGGKVEPLVPGTDVSAGQLSPDGLWRAICFKPSTAPRQIVWALNEYISKPVVKAPVTDDTIEGGETSAVFLKAGWNDINDLGIAYKQGKDGGANLRKQPGGKLIRWLPPNTKVFILKQNPKQKVYAVSTVGPSGGEFGYIADWLIARHLPDPDSDILKINSGDTPIEIARDHYSKKGFNISGKDPRYVVNSLVWVNAHAKHNFPGDPGIKKADKLSDPWWTSKTTADVYIWLPGPTYLNAIYETVVKHGGGTGSITADLWRDLKELGEYFAYGAAFVGGLVHGFVKSLYDAVAGLAEMVIDVLVSIFTANVLDDAKELWDTVSKITWKDFKEVLTVWAEEWEKKLNSNSPWVAGHAHGYLTGYIMAEAAQLLITAGNIAALKGAIWSSRLGKAVKATQAFQKMASAVVKSEKLIDAAVKGEKLASLLSKLNKAREWAAATFKLTKYIIKDLSLAAIERLKKIPKWAHERIRNMTAAAKRLLFGCTSPCKVDLDKIMKILKIPQGFSAKKWKKFSQAARRLAREAGLPKGELAVHGSRATGVAKVTSDIDIILRVDEKVFFDFAQARISSVREGTKLHKTLLKAARKGKLSRFDISPEFNKLLREYLVPHSPFDVDFSIIKKGSTFDTGPFIPLGKF